MISGQNLIAGQWSAQGNETFVAVDPRMEAEGSVRIFNATDGEIDLAVRQAARAFRTMRLVTAAARTAFLESTADVYFGRTEEVLSQRELTKQRTLQERRRVDLHTEVYAV